MHSRALGQLALLRVEEAQVVDRGESRRVIPPERLLVTFQRPLIHGLGLGQLALIPVEGAQAVDRVDSRRVVAPVRLLLAFYPYLPQASRCGRQTPPLKYPVD